MRGIIDLNDTHTIIDVALIRVSMRLSWTYSSELAISQHACQLTHLYLHVCYVCNVIRTEHVHTDPTHITHIGDLIAQPPKYVTITAPKTKYQNGYKTQRQQGRQ